jgi:hypothetical protein
VAVRLIVVAPLPLDRAVHHLVVRAPCKILFMVSKATRTTLVPVELEEVTLVKMVEPVVGSFV